jgi:hypothetical protein
MRARMAAAAGLALAGLMLASCSGDDVPGTLPDVTPTTDGPQETTSATPTGDPTAALEAEITAFYERYVQTINESWTSAEALARRREMFSDSCIACLRGYELAQRAVIEGLILETEPGTIHDVRLDRVERDVVTFLVHEDIPAGRLVNADGNPIQEFGATLGAQVVFRAQHRAAEQWIIVSSDVLSVDGGGS